MDGAHDALTLLIHQVGLVDLVGLLGKASNAFHETNLNRAERQVFGDTVQSGGHGWRSDDVHLPAHDGKGVDAVPISFT